MFCLLYVCTFLAARGDAADAKAHSTVALREVWRVREVAQCPASLINKLIDEPECQLARRLRCTGGELIKLNSNGMQTNFN